MHIQHSRTAEMDLVVSLRPAEPSKDGKRMYPPSVEVWPFGKGETEIGHYLNLDVDEAEEFGRALIEAAEAARALE